MITTKFLPGWNAPLATPPHQASLTSKTHFTELQKTITKVMSVLDSKDYIYAFFQAMNYSGVSPFIATHDYCIKVLYCDENGLIEMNISPIYHLGLEYPEAYQNKHGKKLDEDAVVGLLAKRPEAGTLPPEHTSYSYGIDAGIMFKDSNIAHNKKLTVNLKKTRESLLVILSCDKQTTSTTISLSETGLNQTKVHEVHDSGVEVFPVDWM